MNIKELTRVNNLTEDRARMLTELDWIGRTQGHQYIGVTFQGKYQDDAMCDAIRGKVMTVLRERIINIENDLTALGVTVE